MRSAAFWPATWTVRLTASARTLADRLRRNVDDALPHLAASPIAAPTSVIKLAFIARLLFQR